MYKTTVKVVGSVRGVNGTGSSQGRNVKELTRLSCLFWKCSGQERWWALADKAICNLFCQMASGRGIWLALLGQLVKNS